MLIINKILAAFCLLTFLGCNNPTNSKQLNKVIKQNFCNPYFSFDKVDHYYLDIGESKVWNLVRNEKKTEIEKKQ